MYAYRDMLVISVVKSRKKTSVYRNKNVQFPSRGLQTSPSLIQNNNNNTEIEFLMIEKMHYVFDVSFFSSPLLDRMMIQCLPRYKPESVKRAETSSERMKYVNCHAEEGGGAY